MVTRDVLQTQEGMGIKPRTEAEDKLKGLSRIYRMAKAENFPGSISLTIGDKTYQYVKLQWKVDGETRGLRYGTNPHQSAALYVPKDFSSILENLEWLKWGKGGPSLTNIQDGIQGLRIVSQFDDKATAVMKHINPSGVAISIGDSLKDVYNRARYADKRAAFGSVVVFNSWVDKQTAEAISKNFVEVVYAPDYEPAAISVFKVKENLRVARIPETKDKYDRPNIISLDGSLVFENSYHTKVNSLDEIRKLMVPTKRRPTEEEYKDLLYAWIVASEIRSNGVVFWKNGTSLAIGTGQQDRIGAIENSIDKAKRNEHDLKGSVMASDGFIPNVDNIEAVAKEGVLAIIQPGGSNADSEVIKMCDKHGLAMVFTEERAFNHH